MKSRSLQAGNVSRGPNPRERCARNVWARPGANGSTLSGSGNLDRTQSVGGGHKPRALAHGYSSSTRQPTGSDEPTAFHAIVRLCLGRETGSRRAWPREGSCHGFPKDAVQAGIPGKLCVALAGLFNNQ